MKKITVFLTVITLLSVSVFSTGCNFDINEIFGNSDKIAKLEQQLKDAESKATEKDAKITELEAQIKELKGGNSET